MLSRGHFAFQKPSSYAGLRHFDYYSHSFSRLSFVIFYIYSKPFLHCFEVIFLLCYFLYHHSCCKICCNYSKRIIPSGLYLVLTKRKARQLSRAFAIQAVMYSSSTSRVISEILSINSLSISLPSLSLFNCSRTSVSRSYTAL